MKNKFITKMMKLLSACALVFALGACSTQPADNGDALYKAGTYTAVANGNNGEVEVAVTFSDDKIETIEVTKQKETEGLGTTAMDTLSKAIVDAQSLGVDTIAGATNSSNALLNAVKDCVQQAGGDVEALMNAVINLGAGEEVTLSSDLVVVGGGAAGMSAALRARELGLNVILLEKMSFMGGAISISGGNQVVFGSKLQNEAGVSDDSVESMVADFMANGANLNVPELLQLYAENVGATTDWLHENQNVEFDMEGGLHVLAEYSHNRELAYAGGGSGFAKTYREQVENSGAEVYLNTRATELIVDESGNVIGVKAEGSDGTHYTINAQSVILATGGYGNNKDLLSEEMQSALYYGPQSSTGDGIIMATAENVGAATRLMEYGKRYPNGIEVSEGIAKSTIAGNIAAFSEGAILINSEGKRVVNEKASNREILTVELAQPEQMLYLLMDASTFETFKSKLATGGIAGTDIETWLAANGSSAPVFVKGDSLSELAKVIGMDAAVLENTVSTYNGYVAAGNDEEFNRPAQYMTQPLADGPYYLVEQKPRFATTMGGLVINPSLEVLNAEGNAISGLYAAGEVAGGVMGDDSPSGANNGWALTSGKLPAEAVAEQLGK